MLEGAEPLEVVGNGRSTGSRCVTVADGSERSTSTTDFVFIGTGERPNTGGVEALGSRSDDRGFIVVDYRMRTSVPGVYAIGDLIGAPMEMFKARKCGMTAARNIMGEDRTSSTSPSIPDFLHTTYEVTWVGLTEAEARERYDDVVVIQIQMPPTRGRRRDPAAVRRGHDAVRVHQARADRVPEVRDRRASRRKVLGLHHVGFGAKDAFQYLDHLIHRPGGLTIDEMAR